MATEVKETVGKGKRERRPKTRHRDVILGAIEERLAMLAPMTDSQDERTVDRLYELLSELRRSVGKDADKDADKDAE